jgi:hypothetical protein
MGQTSIAQLKQISDQSVVKVSEKARVLGHATKQLTFLYPDGVVR